LIAFACGLPSVNKGLVFVSDCQLLAAIEGFVPNTCMIDRRQGQIKVKKSE
jgi:hypothetical protein